MVFGEATVNRHEFEQDRKTESPFVGHAGEQRNLFC